MHKIDASEGSCLDYTLFQTITLRYSVYFDLFSWFNTFAVRPEQSFPPLVSRSLGGLGATVPRKKFKSTTSEHDIFHYSITLDLAHQFRQVTMTYTSTRRTSDGTLELQAVAHASQP